MIDETKKGIIIIGSARSGSHMACNMIYETIKKVKVNLGEVIITNDTNEFNYIDELSDSRFICCSIVQHYTKKLLAVDLSRFKSYQMINLRRRDKIAQYISWCVFRSQTGTIKHSPDWNMCVQRLPWDSTREDIERFIEEQYMDFAFKFDNVLYYEDLMNSGLYTETKKNHYPVPFDQIVTNFNLVKSMLSRFNYNDR